MGELDLRQKQTQVQIMSQKQIHSLEILSLGSGDLRSRILEEVDQNPILLIDSDSNKTHTVIRNNTKISSSTKNGEEASEKFLAALEAKADNRTSLYQHLESQLNVLNLSPSELELGTKLIGNLDSKGFHILHPITLIDKNDPNQTPAMLEKLIKTIQNFEPSGLCTKNFQESLFVQAKQSENPPLMALYFLDGNFNLLNPPIASRILKKIKEQFAEYEKMFPKPRQLTDYKELDLSEDSIEEALSFIRTLDPYPARNFGTDDVNYIEPDIYIEKSSEEADKDNLENGIVLGKECTWKIKFARESIPQVSFNPDIEKIQNNENLSEDVKEKIRKAQDFLASLEFRNNTMAKACYHIIKLQEDFFLKGPGNLKPLRQKDLAELLEVHETTISRMANNKYIQCEWGLFPIKSFFTNYVTTSGPKEENITLEDIKHRLLDPIDSESFTEKQSDEKSELSKDNIIHEIKNILEAHKNDQKKLSDQKICDFLEQKGIKIARRTVAKYRSQLNIESSYNRV